MDNLKIMEELLDEGQLRVNVTDNRGRPIEGAKAVILIALIASCIP